MEGEREEVINTEEVASLTHSSPLHHTPSNGSQLVELLRYHGFVVKRVFQAFSEHCLN